MVDKNELRFTKAREEEDESWVTSSWAWEYSGGVHQMGKGMDLLLSQENSITHCGGESQAQSQITANKGQNVMSNECFRQ